MAEGVTPWVKNRLTTLSPLPFDPSILAHVPAFAGRDLSRLRAAPLGSITNSTYRLTLDADSYVVRIAGATTRYLDRATEAHNAGIAHRLGIAPPVLFLDARILLTRYVDGARALTAADLQDTKRLTQIAAMLRRLQAIEQPFQHQRDPFENADRYIAACPHPRSVRLRRELEPVARALAVSTMPMVPTHCDAGASNFILTSDDRLLLVDWEFSAMADRAWDVATIAGQCVDEDAARHFVAAATGDDSPRMLARVALFRLALSLVAASWLAMEAAARQDDTLTPVADSYFDRGEALLKHPDFPSWLGTV